MPAVRSQRLSLGSLGVALALAACGGSSTDTAHATASTTPSGSVSSATSASASSSNSPEAPPTNGIKVTQANELTPLVRCKEAAGPPHVSLYSAGPRGTMLGTCGNFYLWHSLFQIPGEGAAESADRLLADVPHPKSAAMGGVLVFAIFSILGSDLDSLTMRINYPGERGGDNITYVRQGNQWKRKPEVGTSNYWGAYYQGGLRSTGTLKGRDFYERVTSENEYSIEYVDGNKGWLPVPQKGTASCKYQLEGHYDWFTSESAEVTALGSRCEDGSSMPPWMFGSGQPTIERWSPGATVGKEEDLPDVDGYKAVTGHLVPTPKDLYVVLGLESRENPESTRLYVARRGQTGWRALSVPQVDVTKGIETWATEDGFFLAGAGNVMRVRGDDIAFNTAVPPKDGAYTDVAFSPTGAVAMISEGKVYEVDGAGAIQEVALPKGTPETVRYNTMGELFVVATDDSPGGDPAIIYGRRPAVKALELDGSAPKVSPLFYIKPFTPQCEKPIVLLYQLSKVAPENFDYPATREALKGEKQFSAARFVEIQATGQRHLLALFEGAKGRELAKSLRDLVTKRVKGSSPQLFCADDVPTELPIKREIKIDFVTGKLLP
ncbi:MAG: hypothetical protein U0271_06805 [Polyangiaceae bacterium]